LYATACRLNDAFTLVDGVRERSGTNECSHSHLDEVRSSALTARRIGRCKRLVLRTPAYFDRAGTPLTPRDLSKHQAVVYLQGEAAFGLSGVTPPKGL
jgi:hypothetical protein